MDNGNEAHSIPDLPTSQAPSITIEQARKLLRYDPTDGTMRFRLSVGPYEAGDDATCEMDAGRLAIRLGDERPCAARMAAFLQIGKWPGKRASIAFRDGDPRNLAWANLDAASARPDPGQHGPDGKLVVRSNRKAGGWRLLMRVAGAYRHLATYPNRKSAVAGKRVAERAMSGFREPVAGGDA